MCVLTFFKRSLGLALPGDTHAYACAHPPGSATSAHALADALWRAFECMPCMRALNDVLPGNESCLMHKQTFEPVSALTCAGAYHGVRARHPRPHWRVRPCVIRQRSHLCDLHRWPPAKLPALRKTLLAGAPRGAVYVSDNRQRHGHPHHGPSCTHGCVRDHADSAPRSHAHGHRPLDTRWNHARVCYNIMSAGRAWQ